MEHSAEFIPPELEQRTPEAFYEKYGPAIGLTWEQFISMYMEGQTFIGNKYEYHNENHVSEMLWTSMQIADEIERQNPGIEVDRKEVVAIDIYHDARHHSDWKALGFESPEHASADFASYRLQRHGYTPAQILAVKNGIISTKRGEDVTTVEAVVGVLADMANTAAQFEAYCWPKTEDLAVEVERKAQESGAPFAFNSFVRGSIAVISDYIWSLVHNSAGINVDFYAEPATHNLLKIVHYGAALEHITVPEYLTAFQDTVTYKLFVRYLGDKVLSSIQGPTDQAVS